MPNTPTVAVAPGAVPVLGHVLQLYRRPLEFIASLPAHGDLVELRLGPLRAYLACAPDLVTQILLNPRVFDKGGRFMDNVRSVTGNGLATSNHQDHLRQRRLVQPAFHPRRIAAYTAVMSEEIGSVIGAWRPGGTIEIGQEMHDVSVRVTTRTLFSNQIDDRLAAEVEHWLPVILQGIYDRTIMPFGLMKKLPTRSNRRFTKAQAGMRRIVNELAAGSRSGADHDDVLSILLNARDEGTHQWLDNTEIHDHIMNLLLGGTETTGHGLAWAFHLIAAHPDVEKRLHAEVDTVLGGRLPAAQDLPHLPYTQRVFTETLRIYPPAWIFTRTTTAETELAGRRLRTGTTVLYSPYAMHRNGALFPEPERFDPDRWLPERAKAVPRGAMIPFGMGNRKCIGDNFGTTQAILTIAAVVSRWRLRPVPGPAARPVPRATLGITAVPMRTEPRHHAATIPE